MADPFDTANAPLTEPESIVIGSYAAWRRELAYPAAEYSIAYRLTAFVGDHGITIPGTTTDDATWLFEVSSTAENLHANSYRWDLLVTRLSDGEVALIETGMITLFGSAQDRRTHAEIMLAKIESLLTGRADSDVDNYTIKNRSISKMSVKELLEWRDYYRSEIALSGGSVTGAGRAKRNTLRVRWI